MRAQREAVAVSSHGQITGYFIGPDEYEEFKRFRESRRSFATAELPEEKVEAIGTSRMDARHTHLDSLRDTVAALRRMPRPARVEQRQPIDVPLRRRG